MRIAPILKEGLPLFRSPFCDDAARFRMARLYEGNRPSETDGWYSMGRPIEGWELFTKLGEDGWINCKVVAVYPVEGRANYWFSRHKTGPLGRPRDLAIMRNERPVLHDSVLELWEDVYFE